MTVIATERRIYSRRSASRGGGRRVSDTSARFASVPACPNCRQPGVASLAGETEGGWWFVCFACDHLCNQRDPNS